MNFGEGRLLSTSIDLAHIFFQIRTFRFEQLLTALNTLSMFASSVKTVEHFESRNWLSNSSEILSFSGVCWFYYCLLEMNMTTDNRWTWRLPPRRLLPQPWLPSELRAIWLISLQRNTSPTHSMQLARTRQATSPWLNCLFRRKARTEMTI